MKSYEVKKLIGKFVCFSSSRSRVWIRPTAWGVVTEVQGSEACIGDDWHDLSTLEIHKIQENDDETNSS